MDPSNPITLNPGTFVLCHLLSRSLDIIHGGVDPHVPIEERDRGSDVAGGVAQRTAARG